MPDPQACTLIEPPPSPDLQLEDFGIGGQDDDCPAKWEVCLTLKAAKYYLDLQNYADEVWSKCKTKTSQLVPTK